MKIFHQIKSAAGDRALRKSVARNRRKKRAFNLESANSVGILFQIDSELDYNLVHNYANLLKDQKKEVKALGFVKEPALAKYFMPVITFDFITSKEVNWYGRPKSEKYDEFINRKFDICLDFSPAECIAMKFAAANSVASFKVGRFGKEHQMLYDLMLEMKNNHDLGKILKEADRYLKIINPA